MHNPLENNPIIKNTDIFTWALFKKNSKKYITINYSNNEIIKCIFKNNIIKMNAINKNYDKNEKRELLLK